MSDEMGGAGVEWSGMELSWSEKSHWEETEKGEEERGGGGGGQRQRESSLRISGDFGKVDHPRSSVDLSERGNLSSVLRKLCDHIPCSNRSV